MNEPRQPVGRPDTGLSILSTSPKQSAHGYEHWDYPSGDRFLGCGIHLVRDLELMHVYISDITERRESERRLKHAAYHDALTDLPNRRRFMEDAGNAFANPATGAYAVLLVNLDRFQRLTESLGHGVSDTVLRAVVERLCEVARQDGGFFGCTTVYRFEGDVFAVLLFGPPASLPQNAIGLAERMLRSFEAPFYAGDREFFLTASIGVALYPEDARDGAMALKNADLAVQQVKRDGGRGYMRFCAELATLATERLELNHALRHALARKELSLVYQPQIDIRSGNIVGVEALVRWQHPDFGAVSPAKFIPVAEESGLIAGIGEWVLREACIQGRKWNQPGISLSLGRQCVGTTIQRHPLLPNGHRHTRGNRAAARSVGTGDHGDCRDARRGADPSACCRRFSIWRISSPGSGALPCPFEPRGQRRRPPLRGSLGRSSLTRSCLPRNLWPFNALIAARAS